MSHEEALAAFNDYLENPSAPPEDLAQRTTFIMLRQWLMFAQMEDAWGYMNDHERAVLIANTLAQAESALAGHTNH